MDERDLYRQATGKEPPELPDTDVLAWQWQPPDDDDEEPPPVVIPGQETLDL